MADFSNTAATVAIQLKQPAHYALQCQSCGAVTVDDGLQLQCLERHEPALLSTRYAESSFRTAPEADGLFRYRSWLPVRKPILGAVRSVVYRSEALCQVTGLQNLWIAFHGYWPEKGSYFPTGTFKDLEAYCVIGRLPDAAPGVMVVASAGNTAAAFASVCSVNEVRCLIVIPETGLDRMWFEEALNPCVKLAVLSEGADYSDAIALSEKLSQRPGFFLEGGVRNVGRRDGLGTVLLSVFETIGRLPDYYFQAIGSGAGAIAVHDAAYRITNGRGPFPSLMLSQNLPFTPISQAWKLRSNVWTVPVEEVAKRQIACMQARVLSNRRPPYAIKGGLYDALRMSAGDVYEIDNSQLAAAAALFQQIEGIDIEAAGAVSFASLLSQRRNGDPPDSSTVVLNITGGGSRRRAQDVRLCPALPDLEIRLSDAQTPLALDRIVELWR